MKKNETREGAACPPWSRSVKAKRQPGQIPLSSVCQPLHTSIQPSQWEYSVSSSQVSSMAELELPAAGNTVAKRLRDTSR